MPINALGDHMSRAVATRPERSKAYRNHQEWLNARSERASFPGPDPVHIGRGKQAGGFTLMRAKTAYLPTKGEEIRLLSVSATYTRRFSE